MSPQPSRADVVDRCIQASALMILAIALIFAASVARHWVGDSAAQLLEIASKALAVLIVAAGAVLFVQKWRTRRQPDVLADEEFAVDAFRRACTASWILSFVLLTQSDRLLVLLPAATPPAACGELILAAMAATFSVAYFVLRCGVLPFNRHAAHGPGSRRP